MKKNTKVTLIMKEMSLSNYLTQILRLQPINISSRLCEFGLVICYLQIGLQSSSTYRKLY